MSLYGDLCFVDILEPIRGKYKIEFDENGEPKIFLKPILALDSPWISTMPKPDRLCQLWSQYFNHYGIVPKTCRGCFKVGLEVDTLDRLFKVMDYQRDNQDNAKCGIETRQFVGRLGRYSAFWYCPIEEGFEGAEAVYKRVTKAFPTLKAILKRGCTEFELRYNPSDKWDEFAQRGAWDAKESLLDQLFSIDPQTIQIEMNTPKMLEVHIIKRWIEWAFEHGDKTYLNFVDQPFKQELLNYHGKPGLGIGGLGKSSDENSGESAGRKAPLIQRLSEDE